MTNRKVLRERCEVRLRELRLPSPFDFHVFCQTLGTHRCRPILLHPIARLGEVSGVWVAGHSADHIFFEADTSTLHQELIILHELSHLICGHLPLPVTEGELSQLFFPHLEPVAVRYALGRHAAYSLEDEQEAELLATLILEQVTRTPVATSTPADPAAARLVRRLEASFEGYRGQER